MNDDSDPTGNQPASALPALLPKHDVLAVLHEDLELAGELKKAARAASTHRAYSSDWKIYEAWCISRGLSPMPAHPEQIAAFAGSQWKAGHKSTTIDRRIAAVGHFHRLSNYSAPTAHPEAGGLREALAGIRNKRKDVKTRKSAADAAAIRHMLIEIKGDGLRAKRELG